MIWYADTCILLSLFFRDTGSEAALAWLEQAGTDRVVITPWTRTEFASAAGILARRGDVPGDLHRQGLAGFDRFIEARLTVEPLTNIDFDRAHTWLSTVESGLRAGDALHLAACSRLNARLCTADGQLANAAHTLGIRVHTPA